MTDFELSESDIVKTADAVLAVLDQLQQRQDDVEGVHDTSAFAAWQKLRQLAETVHSMSTRSSCHSTLSSLSTLTRICDQKFTTFNYNDIPMSWRAIYVDTQLLKACCVLKDSSSVSTEQDALLRLCIRDLDLALIVAGAVSLNKGKPCHALISALQTRLLRLDSTGQHKPAEQSDEQSDEQSPPRKRSKLMRSEPPKPMFGPSAQADSDIIEYTFDQAPSFMDLTDPDSAHRFKPFIVRGYAQGARWPAVASDDEESKHRSWSSIDHLLRVAGPARVVPVEVGADYSRDDWGQDLMLWSDFLQQCRWDQPVVPSQSSEKKNTSSSAIPQPILYMAQHDLSSQFPALERDYTLPDYVYTSPPPPDNWPQYRPPATSDGVVTNLWIGPAGTVSPPHHDPYYNCFVQAVGYKEVWVAPPHCCPRNEASPSNQSSDGGDAHPSSSLELSPAARADTKTSITETLMANTASVDVFDPIELVPDLVRAAAAKAILGPGDLLYMPPGWWHSLRSLTRSFSVSMWF